MLKVGDYQVLTPDFGDYVEEFILLKRGYSYDISFDHLGTHPYVNYTPPLIMVDANVGASEHTSGPASFIEDPFCILGAIRFPEGFLFPNRGKKAKLSAIMLKIDPNSLPDFDGDKSLIIGYNQFRCMYSLGPYSILQTDHTCKFIVELRGVGNAADTNLELGYNKIVSWDGKYAPKPDYYVAGNIYNGNISVVSNTTQQIRKDFSISVKAKTILVRGSDDVSSSHYDNIKSCLSNYGYNDQTILDNKSDVIQNCQCRLIWYNFGHGRLTSQVYVGPEIYEELLKPSDLPSENMKYWLVFMNNCYSARQNPGDVTDAFIAKFNADMFLGWKTAVNLPQCSGVASKFFEILIEQVNGKSIYEIFIMTRDQLGDLNMSEIHGTPVYLSETWTLLLKRERKIPLVK